MSHNIDNFGINTDLQEEMDEREGQVFRDYDCFFNEIVDGCNKFNIEKPAMFMKEPDHTCFTYYHKNKKNNEDEKLQEKEEGSCIQSD